ncbi:MAG: membrane protein insertase YidC [Pseudomonadota bacterium]
MKNFPSDPHDTQDNFRLLLAIVISLGILLVFRNFFDAPQPGKTQQQQQQMQAQKAASAPLAEQQPAGSLQDMIKATRRIPIHGEKVAGSLSLTGARIDDLTLNGHTATAGSKENMALLSPSGTKDAYYVESGWTADDKDVPLPDSKTVWTLANGSAAVLKTNGAVTLQWDNGQGLLFERKIGLDENYLFTITQKIINKTNAERKFNAWHLISRHSLPVDFKGFFILHEGPLGYLDDKLQEPSYKDMDKGGSIERENTSGWLGITDKYWFVGIFPNPQERFNARIIGSTVNNKRAYQTDVVAETQTAAPGQSIEDKKFIFAGVKNLDLMMEYQQKYGLGHLDLTFDFGWWYFITKPFFYLLHFLMSLTGNVGLAILSMTVIIRALVFPLANKSFLSMAGMKRIAPVLKELQTKYSHDKEKLQMEIFELYKREKVNPFSGCWPIMVQIPIFFALYKVIMLSVELRHAPFWGWIRDLSAPDPTNIFTLFGFIPWTPPSFLAIGAWPALFCLTMIIQKRLTPPMPDKTQEQLQTWFPFIITFMLANFAAGLVIYWTWSNVLGVLQQYYILRKLGGQEVSLIHGHSERRRKKPKTEGK